jgi:hypothetical protein
MKKRRRIMDKKQTPEMPSNATAESKTAATASSTITHERLMKKLSANPRFKEAPKSGEAFTIVGAHRHA